MKQKARKCEEGDATATLSKKQKKKRRKSNELLDYSSKEEDMKQKARREYEEEEPLGILSKKQKKKKRKSNEQLDYSSKEDLKQKAKRECEEDDPTDTLSKKQKKRRSKSNEQLDYSSKEDIKEKTKRECEEEVPTDTLNKKQKTKRIKSNELLDHEQNESLNNLESKIRKKHKQGKKKKKVKEITVLDESKEKAVSYLNKWKYDRQNWKFEKVRQVWLLKHMLKDGKVPDSVFPTLVEYLNGAKGHARQVVLEKTMEVVSVMEQCAELAEQGMDEEDIAKQCPKRVSEKMYERARTVLQCLQENE